MTDSRILFIYTVSLLHCLLRNILAIMFYLPISISGLVPWQVTLSSLCTVKLDIDVGTHYWHVVLDREGILQDFPSWAMKTPLFSSVQPLSYPLSYLLRDIFRHIQVTVCVLPPYHRYTRGTERESTLICCCDTNDPDGFHLHGSECTQSHACMKMIIWFRCHVSWTGVWARIVKCVTFIGCLFFCISLKSSFTTLLKRSLHNCRSNN